MAVAVEVAVNNVSSADGKEVLGTAYRAMFSENKLRIYIHYRSGDRKKTSEGNI
jgi:hypothetical protein